MGPSVVVVVERNTTYFGTLQDLRWMADLLGFGNGSRCIIAQLHERIIHLLDLRMRIRRGVSTLRFILFLDPKVRLAQSFLNLNTGFPPKFLTNQHIVGITTTNAHGTVNVLDGEPLIFKGHPQRNHQ